MHKRFVIAAATITLMVVVGAAALLFNSRQDGDTADSSPVSSQPGAPGDSASSETPGAGDPVTLTGEMTCLTRKNTDGPTTMECAIGLRADDGKQYGLGSDDPTMTGSVPTGKRVRVTGTLSTGTAAGSVYDIAGVVKVQTLERL